MQNGWELADGWTMMLGAACGDVAGSFFEVFNIKEKLPIDQLLNQQSRFTDDTVCTCAVADGIRHGLVRVPDQWLGDAEAEQTLTAEVTRSLVFFCRRYPDAGYGGSFQKWVRSPYRKPYHSWGNGSAMRASYAGWVARTLAEAERLGELSAAPTHDHEFGLKGARVVAGCIFVLRECMARGSSVEEAKQTVRDYASTSYDLGFCLDDIREAYDFDVSCEGSVPKAIVAFLEGMDFCDVISSAISIGGDSDTIAAIAASMAEVCYPIPPDVQAAVIERLDNLLLEAISDAAAFAQERTRTLG